MEADRQYYDIYIDTKERILVEWVYDYNGDKVISRKPYNLSEITNKTDNLTILECHGDIKNDGIHDLIYDITAYFGPMRLLSGDSRVYTKANSDDDDEPYVQIHFRFDNGSSRNFITDNFNNFKKITITNTYFTYPDRFDMSLYGWVDLYYE
jgi:hypothetical protein